MIRQISRPDGTRVLSLRDGWSEEAAAAIGVGDFDILSIGTGNWSEFHALARYARQIKRLMVASGVDTYKGLDRLVELVDIDLPDAPTPQLDLLAFRELERCYLHWHKKYPSEFFALPRLADITISSYTGHDCSDISTAQNLVRLDLRRGSVQSLNGVERLSKLRFLSLAYMRNLHDISFAAALPQLEVLHIEKCPKLQDIEFICDLPHLRTLFVDCGGPGFADLTWMIKLEQLVDVLIAVPVRSVDWSILFSLPNLQRVVINTHVGYQLDEEEMFACAKTHGRTLENYTKAGTKAHPAVKFWMAPL